MGMEDLTGVQTLPIFPKRTPEAQGHEVLGKALMILRIWSCSFQINGVGWWGRFSPQKLNSPNVDLHSYSGSFVTDFSPS